MKLINLNNGKVIADRVGKADSFWQRFKGLMFTKSLPSGSALHIEPCRSIHTFFMNYPIDVLYLDPSQRIIATELEVKPGKIGKVYGQAASVMELPAGTIRQTETEIGHSVQIFENGEENS